MGDRREEGNGGRGGDGEMISLRGMKKKAEEKDKQLEEEKKRAEEERRKREEEKLQFEERIRNMEQEMSEMKRLIPITSLGGTSVIFPQSDNINREGNTLIHHGDDLFRNCFIGGEMTSV